MYTTFHEGIRAHTNKEICKILYKVIVRHYIQLIQLGLTQTIVKWQHACKNMKIR